MSGHDRQASQRSEKGLYLNCCQLKRGLCELQSMLPYVVNGHSALLGNVLVDNTELPKGSPRPTFGKTDIGSSLHTLAFLGGTGSAVFTDNTQSLGLKDSQHTLVVWDFGSSLPQSEPKPQTANSCRSHLGLLCTLR